MEETAKQLFKSTGNVKDDRAVDDLLARLCSAIIQTSLSLPHSMPKARTSGKQEWNPDTKETYNIALQVWKTWKKAGKPRHGILHRRYLQRKREFRRQLRQSRAKIHRKTLKDIENASSRDQKLFHRLIKMNRSSTTSHATETIKYKDRVFQGPYEILEGWGMYFKDLADPDHQGNMELRETDHHIQDNHNKSNHGTALMITSQELKQAVATLKKGKASGPDNISPEHLIYLGRTALQLILFIFNYFLSTSHTSQCLKTGLILPFHKGKGKDEQDPRNYRGITLTSTLAKLLELVLKPRLEKSLYENNIPDEMQFGFQKGHSCMLTSCTLELVIECNTSQKRTTYVALLDAEKAFDKIWHEGPFHKTDETNIDPAHTMLLRSL